MILTENEAIAEMQTNRGDRLSDLSKKSPVLVVFLRHFGCQFCKDSMTQLSKLKPKLVKKEVELVLVHMSEQQTADVFFEKFHLSGFASVSDPDCRFYTAFGLTKGSFNQLFGFKTWMKGFSLQIKYGAEFGKHLGDNFQMPGIFMICDGQIECRFIPIQVAERLDYESLIENCCRPISRLSFADV